MTAFHSGFEKEWPQTMAGRLWNDQVVFTARVALGLNTETNVATIDHAFSFICAQMQIIV